MNPSFSMPEKVSIDVPFVRRLPIYVRIGLVGLCLAGGLWASPETVGDAVESSVSGEVALAPVSETLPVAVPAGKTIVPRDMGNDLFVPGSGRQVSMSRSVFMIFAVLVGMAVIGYLAKRGKLPIKGITDSGVLRIKETRMLGNKQFLVVVEHQDRKMLLGVGPGFISYLCPLSGSTGHSNESQVFEASLRQHIGPHENQDSSVGAESHG